MEIREMKQNGFVTLAPAGDLDANSSLELDARIQKLIEAGEVNLHIDGQSLRYISSAGIGVFISYLDEIQSGGGRLVFSNLSANVLDVFELLGLNQIVTIVTDGGAVAPLFAK